MAENRKVLLEKVGKDRNIIKIRFPEPLNSKLSANCLIAAFNQCFKHSFYKIILDMTNVDEPGHDFVATLIEATAKVRTRNGDVKIINMSPSAEQTMAGFNAYAYLSVPREDIEM